MTIPAIVYYDTDNPAAVSEYNSLMASGEINMIPPIKMLIAIGGDGTLIRALHTYPEIPDGFSVGLIGTGTVNYLAMGDHPVCTEIRTLEASIYDSGYTVPNTGMSPIVNEISITSLDRKRMLKFDISIDDELVCQSVRGDGVIVATAIGSTAYAMSAGGPIVDIDTPVNVIVMSNEYSRKSRPIVLSNDKKITIHTYTDSCMIVDGIKEYAMHGEGYIEIRPYKTIDLWHANSLVREEKNR